MRSPVLSILAGLTCAVLALPLDGLAEAPTHQHYVVRQTLGAVLLEAGRPAEAEAVYWEDLKRNPENGWSLFGLAKSLRAQGKSDEAAEVEKQFHTAWADADIELASSRSTSRR